MNNLPYDNSSIQDIFRYSEELIGLSFTEVLSNVFDGNALSEKIKYYDNPKGKGSLGNLLEEHYFFYRPNNESIPDFDKVGMELKVIKKCKILQVNGLRKQRKKLFFVFLV